MAESKYAVVISSASSVTVEGRMVVVVIFFVGFGFFVVVT